MATCGSQRRTTRIIWRAHWATVLCLSPRRSLTCGVGAGTLKMGKAQQRLFQGGVMTRVSTIQRRPLVLTVRLRRQRVAVMTALADTSAPASLQSFVNDEREAAASGIEGLHQQGQQTATAFESGPAND